MPTWAPSAAKAKAKLTAVVDLPTPPLPLAMAMIFFTPGKSFTPRCTACATILLVMVMFTLVTPGIVLTARIANPRIKSN